MPAESIESRPDAARVLLFQNPASLGKQKEIRLVHQGHELSPDGLASENRPGIPSGAPNSIAVRSTCSGRTCTWTPKALDSKQKLPAFTPCRASATSRRCGWMQLLLAPRNPCRRPLTCFNRAPDCPGRRPLSITSPSAASERRKHESRPHDSLMSQSSTNSRKPMSLEVPVLDMNSASQGGFQLAFGWLLACF